MKRLAAFMVLVVFLALAVTAQGNRIYVEDFEIEPGEYGCMPVLLTNVDPSRGLQFNITLPIGLELEESELTPYARGKKMFLSSNFSPKDGCYTVFIYPMGTICFPADTTAAVMTMTLKARETFKGGTISAWKCRGATADNKTIYMEGDTARVTVPESALVGVPIDSKSDDGGFFNLND